MLLLRSFLFLSLLLIPALLHAADEKPLTFENVGLKNNYRIVFEQWDEANHFASGAIEITDNNEDKLHTRIPFAVEVKADAKNKKVEVLTVRCTALVHFFPPGNKKDPYPPLIWKLTGRKTKEAVLKASFWSFGKEAWAPEEMEFAKAEK